MHSRGWADGLRGLDDMAVVGEQKHLCLCR